MATVQGSRLIEVWRKAEGFVEYVLSEDSAFEKWMDKYDPGWDLSLNGGTIERNRDIWAAGIEWARNREVGLAAVEIKET